MIASGQNLSLYLGDSFSQDFNITGYDLTAWTGEAAVKYRYDLTGYALIFDYEAIDSNIFNLSCSSEQTTGLAVGNHYYNVKISSGNSIQTIYYGYISIYPSVIYN